MSQVRNSPKTWAPETTCLTDKRTHESRRLCPSSDRGLCFELEKKASSNHKLAEEVRERLIIQNWPIPFPMKTALVDLLRSALLIARLDNAHFELDGYLRKADLLAQKIKMKFSDKTTASKGYAFWCPNVHEGLSR